MIGILPAAGSAVRMSGLPKMLLPIPGGCLLSVLRERMAVCNIDKLVVGTRGTNLEYLQGILNTPNITLFQADTQTMSETVLRSREYIQEHEAVAFGMPDTYFDDENAFCKLRAALQAGADVAVGIFRTRPEQTSKLGMVELEGRSVVAVIDKPKRTTLKYAWGILAWKPAYWDYIRESDPHVGYALPYAIDIGLKVVGVPMDGGYWDCGTAAEYFDLIHHLTKGRR